MTRGRELIAGFVGFAFALMAGAAMAQPARGINVNPWFTKPDTDGTWQRDGAGFTWSWPPFEGVDLAEMERELDRIAAAGFDHIRLPIHPGPYLHHPEEDVAQGLAAPMQIVTAARDRGLFVFAHFHSAGPSVARYSEIVQEPLRTHFLHMTSVMAQELFEISGGEGVAMELLNEPTTDCGDPVWRDFATELADVLESHGIDAVWAGACWSSIPGLIAGPPLDGADFVAFHFYEPFAFTHQSAPWTGAPGITGLRGLTWPPSPAALPRALARTNEAHRELSLGPEELDAARPRLRSFMLSGMDTAALERRLGEVADWADAAGVPRDRVIMGEFGVLRRERGFDGADIDSAARWLRTVRSAAESYGFAWTMWSYGEGMALTAETDTGAWEPAIVEALGIDLIAPAGDHDE